MSIDLATLGPAARAQVAAQPKPKRPRPKLDHAGLWGRAWTIEGHDLARWVREFRFMTARRYRLDWAHVATRTAVEVDGGVWVGKGGRHNTDEDRWKVAEAQGRGWVVFRFSPAMLRKEPARAVALVAAAIAERGQ